MDKGLPPPSLNVGHLPPKWLAWGEQFDAPLHPSFLQGPELLINSSQGIGYGDNSVQLGGQPTAELPGGWPHQLRPYESLEIRPGIAQPLDRRPGLMGHLLGLGAEGLVPLSGQAGEELFSRDFARPHHFIEMGGRFSHRPGRSIEGARDNIPQLPAQLLHADHALARHLLQGQKRQRGPLT